MFINDNTGIAVGAGGTILKTTNGGTPIGITQTSNQIPEQFLLKQNYPNPFNPTTTIGFDLQQRGVVKLMVYDLLGREIETLVNQELSAGTYNAEWRAVSFSSGVYFYSLTSGNHTETKKMILIK